MTRTKEELIETYKELLAAKDYISDEDFFDIAANILDAMSLLEMTDKDGYICN